MATPLNPSATADIVARAHRAVRGSQFHHRARMESRQARPQGDRLHADLRAARTHPRRRHAAARHRRRRRPARSHPRRRLLPELHLPHPALDHRARRLRPPRFRRRHAVPVDLRRDPQSVRHVEDDVPARLFALFRRAAELPRRHRRQLLRQRDGRAAPRSRRAARQADHRRRAAPFDRGLQRKPPAGARALRSSARRSRGRRRRRKSIWWCAPAWCCRSRSTPSCCAIISPRRAPRSGRCATIAASC